MNHQDERPGFRRAWCLRLAGAAMVVMWMGTNCLGAPTAEAPPDLTGLSLEELYAVKIGTVEGASKHSESVRQAPASVTIIPEDEIKKHGYRTLAEILAATPGIYTSYDRNYEYLGLHGFGRPGDLNARFLLLINGHRINDNVYDSAAVGQEFLLDVDLIDRVEVIRGPGSALYGSSAFFGVINVITRRGGDIKGAEVSGSYATFDAAKGRVTYGDKLRNGLEFLFSGTIGDSQGQRSLYYPEYQGINNGLAVKADGSRVQNVFASLAYKDFTLEGGFSSSTKHLPTASFFTVFNDPRNHTVDQHAYADLRFERQLTPTSQLTARLFYDNFFYRGIYIYDPVGAGNPADFSDNRDYGIGSWWGFETKYRTEILERLSLDVGFEFRNNLRQDQLNFSHNPYSVALEDQRSSVIYSPYAQVGFSILTNLTLTAGGRYDHFEVFGGTANPRVSLVYAPAKETTVKLLYGQAFRAPNAFEAYYQDGGISQKENLGLKPETIETMEVVVEQGLPWFQTASLSGFYSSIHNLITQEVDPADGLLVFRNRNEIETRGLDFGLIGNYGGGWRSRLGYTFQEARDVGAGGRLSNSPKHLVKASLTAPLGTEKITAGLDANYLSSRDSRFGGRAGGQWWLNGTLFSRELVKGLELSLGVYNLLDRHYKVPVGGEFQQEFIEQDGRTFRAKLTWHFSPY